MERYLQIDRRADKLNGLCLFVFLLTALQLARVKIGPIPIYFVEAILVILIMRTPKTKVAVLSKNSSRILTSSKVFFLFVVLGELRGAISYNFILPAVYQIFRYGLGVYLIFLLPRIVRTKHQFQVILKAVVLGMLVTGGLSIISSLPPTRPIAKIIFSNSIINPSEGKGLTRYSMVRGDDRAVRGTSLIGPATFTGAYLCTLWPLGLLAYRMLSSARKWKRVALLVCIVVPIGALVTYSRSSWFGISSIVCMIGLLGFSGNRRILFLAITIIFLIVSQIGLNSSFLYMERIENRTTATFNDPLASGDVRERFLSYTQPLSHLFQNPSWLIAGAGSAGDKMADRGSIDRLIYDQEKLATHSAISWAYYGFGLPGAMCHIFLMLFAFNLIRRNIRYARQTQSEEIKAWQAFLAVWLGGLLPWWSFGHGVVSTARGSMFFFFIIALFITYDQLQSDPKTTADT